MKRSQIGDRHKPDWRLTEAKLEMEINQNGDRKPPDWRWTDWR